MHGIEKEEGQPSTGQREMEWSGREGRHRASPSKQIHFHLFPEFQAV